MGSGASTGSGGAAGAGQSNSAERNLDEEWRNLEAAKRELEAEAMQLKSTQDEEQQKQQAAEKERLDAQRKAIECDQQKVLEEKQKLARLRQELEENQRQLETTRGTVAAPDGNTQQTIAIPELKSSMLDPLVERRIKADQEFEQAERRLEEERRNQQGGNQTLPTPKDLQEAQQHYMDSNPEIELDEEGIPLPHPPRKWREDWFKVEDFKEIDAYALNAPKDYGWGEMKELVGHLVKPCSTQLEKVRVLVRWIAAHSSSEPQQPLEGKEDTPLGMAATQEFNLLLYKMLRCTEIPCKILHGIGKDGYYDVGQASTIKTASWISIFIDQNWWNMDMNCVCSGVKGVKVGQWKKIDEGGKNMVRVKSAKTREVDVYGLMDENFFLPNPHGFAFQFFPDDARWQLMARTLTQEEFKNICFCKQVFFQHGLQLASHPGFEVTTRVGECKMAIKHPINRKIQFTYRFSVAKDVLTESSYPDFEAMRKFVFAEKSEGGWAATLYCPKEGTYKLEIFSKDPKTDQNLTEACTYLIRCFTTDPKREALPDNTRGLWGPGYDTEESGLVPLSHPKGCIEATDGIAEIHFQVEDGVAVTYQLSGVDAKSYNNYIVHKQQGDNITLFVRLPVRGRYALHIYAQRDGENGRRNVCTYLVDAVKCAIFRDPFPEMNRGQVGLSDSFDTKIGLEKKNHRDSYMQAEKQVTLEFTIQIPAELKAYLKRQSEPNVDPEDMDDFCSVQYIAEKEVTFICQFPKAGVYHFAIYGRRLAAGNEVNFSPLADYVLEVAEAGTTEISYPEVRNRTEWCKGYRVIKPTRGTVLPNEEVEFEIDAPQDTTALYLTGKERVEMTKEGQIWHGKVQSASEGISVVVSISQELWRLVHFKATTPEKMKQLENEKEKAKKELEKAEEQRQRDEEETARRRREREQLGRQEDEDLQTRGIKRTRIIGEDGLGAVDELQVRLYSAKVKRLEAQLDEAKVELRIVQEKHNTTV